jgi:hypothetical protein
MSEWTLGSVKARGMEIVALCDNADCRHLFSFDLDALIEQAGADFPLGEIPPLACPRCGERPLTIRLSFADPPGAEQD